MPLSDPVRVVVGVAPSPEIPAQAAAVAKQIEVSMQQNLRTMLRAMPGSILDSVSGSLRTPFRNVFGAIGSDMFGAIGGAVAIGSITRAFEGAISTGLKFNETVEGVRIGLAGMMMQMHPGMFKTWESATTGAEKILAGLKVEALTTVATFQDLAQATQGLIGPILSAGIPLEKASATAAMIARATSAIMPWAREGQIIQEGRALLTGNINQNAFIANALGISREQIMEARKAGTVMEFLNKKLGAFNIASAEAANTLSGLISNTRDAFQFSMGEATESMLSQLKTFVIDIKAYVGSQEFKGLAMDFMSTVVDAMRAAGMIAKALSPVGSWMRDQSTYWGTMAGAAYGKLMYGGGEGILESASQELWVQRAIRSGSASGQAEAIELLEQIRDSLKGTVKVEVPGL